MTSLKNTFDHLDSCPNLSLDVRKRRLKSLKSVIKDHSEDIVKALNTDYGRRSEEETRIAEIMVCLDEIQHTLKKLDQWVKPQKSLSSYKFMFSKVAVQPQPLGVVGIMAPWNYPFNLAIAPLIAAIAAGNKVMVKPSEVTPATAQLIEDLLTKVFSKDEVAACQGDVSVSQEFSALPFKHLLFTGSTTVGKHIMSAAAKNLCEVTLELGGKSPTLIDESYSLKTAARSIIGGKFFNAGQTCIAPDYIMVPKSRLQDLIKALSDEVQRCFPDPTENPDYTAVINSHHFQRLSQLVEEVESSTELVWPVGDKKDEDSQIFPPLFLIHPDDKSKIMREEIFGPLLPILTYDSVDEALEYINQRPNPLTLYLYSNSAKTIKKVSDSSLSGSFSVNETLAQFAQKGIAFGGVGASGMGGYHGYDGFKAFSHLKSVYFQSRLNFNFIARAPFSSLKKKLVKILSTN